MDRMICIIPEPFPLVEDSLTLKLIKMNLGKLKNSKTTRRKQLVENTRRKTRRKATRRKFSDGKLVARIENNLKQI